MNRPTFDELKNRIERHLAFRGSSDECNLVWSGYLAALMEWGLLGPDDYHRLRRTLRVERREVVREIFLGVNN